MPSKALIRGQDVLIAKKLASPFGRGVAVGDGEGKKAGLIRSTLDKERKNL